LLTLIPANLVTFLAIGVRHITNTALRRHAVDSPQMSIRGCATVAQIFNLNRSIVFCW
jgi:hypothetical protein